MTDRYNINEGSTNESDEDVKIKYFKTQDKEYSDGDFKNDLHDSSPVVPGSKSDPFRSYRIVKQASLVTIWFAIVSSI